MKLASIVLVSALFFSHISFSVDAARLLQRDTVVKKVAEIEKKVMRERMVAAAVITAGVVSFFSGVTIRDAELSATGIVSGSVGWIKNGFENGKHLFFTTDGWLNIARFGFNCAGAIGCSLITQELIKKFWHPNTLYWYVHTHVSYEAAFMSVKDAAHLLKKSDITAQQRQLYHNSLQIACFQLNRNAASVCAYMLYKGKELFPQETVLTQKMSVYFFNYHNDWLADFIEIIESPHPDYEKLIEHCSAYEKEVKSICTQFASIEGETVEQRRAIEG